MRRPRFSPFHLVLSLLIFNCLSFSGKANKIDFLQMEFRDIVSKATEADKPFFVFFSADWCLPCQVMDEYTYSDKAVFDFVSVNMLAVKVDFDKNINEEWKTNFEVNFLPTIILFDKNGTLLDRSEETMTANELLGFFEKSLNIPRKIPINISPSHAKVQEVAPPVKVINQAPIQGNFLKHGVQVGDLTSMSETLPIMKQLRKEIEYPIMVLPVTIGSESLFKIVIGDFDDALDAVALEDLLRKKGHVGKVVVLE